MGDLPVFAALDKAWLGAISQGACAALIATLLGSPWWWRLIHLCFMPLLVWAHGLMLPGWVWPAGFFLLLLFFGWPGGSRAPLYLTRRADRAAVLSLLPAHPSRVIDLGCGDGALLRHLARARPDCLFVGLEQAPLSWAWAWLAARGIRNLSIVHGDFWRYSLSGYDLVYAFLSPAAMTRLWHKARAEMSSDALLVSYRFPLPDLTPSAAIAARATGHAGLYCYLPAAGSRSGDADSE